MDGNLWRAASNSPTLRYPSCDINYQGSGMLIGESLPIPVMFADDIYFQSFCYSGSPAFMSGTLYDIPATYLESVVADWNMFLALDGSCSGSFKFGIFPMIVSFTTNFIITFTLTVLIFLSMNDKPYVYASRLLKIGSLISTVNLAISLSNLINLLRHQYEKYGILGKFYMVQFFELNATFVTLDFLSTFILQCCQTFILMRIFERKKEQKVIFFVGITLAIVSNLLWAVPRYHEIVHGISVKDENNNWELLPPFVYMFKIIIAASYACLIINFIIRKRHQCFKTAQLTLLTLLTILVILLLPGFFIADLASFWIYEFSELFNTTFYVSCTFVVWEWLERLSIIQKREQAQSILGRAIYEDEQQNYTFAKYTLKVQDALTRKVSSSTFSSDEITKSSNIKDYPTSNKSDESYMSKLHLSTTKTIRVRTSTSEVEEGDDVDSGDPLAPTDDIRDIQSINQVHFNTERSYKDIAHSTFDNTVNNVVYFSDKIGKTLGSYSFGSSSKSSSDSKKEKNEVKRRIGLDMTNKVYVYSTKDVEFDSDLENDTDT
ncbi:similar to Saccharomyces cerevisiae YNL294C RIM21 Component of the RIM101 pathway, has a role in cell wall construction and alkaline pH response [Maudiozyma saulgeensis]|uniref:pH-response regulator protein palH/RIM21 n=1 Tax=Maudiozyma saulgeensis TaxID=1789683 RepID=A0A1X7R1H1_9SACH|nr:similar to Saccharomyces cerevisiae YNL294C RIM21 Component of the RIM101 pathway, has a role in cell wall construction and alkaline pH response [Kazachstania saulgeensis]